MAVTQQLPTTDEQLQVQTLPVAAEGSGHVMCCANDDVSLCAQDISNLTITEDNRPSGCAVCDYLETTDFCPLLGMCRHPDADS